MTALNKFLACGWVSGDRTESSSLKVTVATSILLKPTGLLFETMNFTAPALTALFIQSGAAVLPLTEWTEAP